MSRWSLLHCMRLLVLGRPLNRLLQTPALLQRLRPRDSGVLLLHDTDDFDGPAVDLADLNHLLLPLLLLR